MNGYIVYPFFLPFDTLDEMNKKLYENDYRHVNMKLEKEDIVYDVIRLVSLRIRCSSCCFLSRYVLQV